MREDMRYKVIERGRFGDNSNHSSKSRRRTFRGQSDATNKGRMRPDWRGWTGNSSATPSTRWSGTSGPASTGSGTLCGPRFVRTSAPGRP